MTRINCVPVEELTDKHLGAEYRELPRVFGQALDAYARGEDPASHPQAYCLGKGHVKFFYTRLGYLERRFAQLVRECRRRGRTVNYEQVPWFVQALPRSWRRDWVPNKQALKINRARIATRLSR